MSLTQELVRPAALVVPGPHDSIAQRLSEVAAVIPADLAAASDGQRYTYAELDRTARVWARSLVAHNADLAEGTPVALDLEPSASCLVGLIAVMLSGRPVIPLDPMLPQARVEQILDASGARRLSVSALDRLPRAETAVLPECGPDDPAVIFYTSGSTGRPKGLAHSHAAWLNVAYLTREAMLLREDERHALVVPVSYGVGLDVLFTALLNGTSVHVRDPRTQGIDGIGGWLAEHGVTALHATPSLLVSILDTLRPDEVLKGVRTVSTCGEAIHSAVVRRLREHLAPDATYVNWCGASEVGPIAHFRLDPGAEVPSGIVPVGHAAANKTVELLDGDGRPVGPETTGEVVITSRYLSLGYHNDPAATATRFTANADGTTSYRGGDLGRWDAEGRLHLRGRADAALKIGGYLVEPAEVEAALLDLPQVKEAVVLATTRPGEGVPKPELTAYVVPVAAERAPAPVLLRRALRERLPSWMVPSEVVLLSELPRTERAKVDRQALPEPGRRPPFRAPSGRAEEMIAEIWCRVLGVAEVSAADDFWLLGADSLTVVEMFAAVRRATGVKLTSADLADAPTITDLAVLLEGRRTRPLPPTCVRLRSGDTAPAVFGFAGGGASGLSLLSLALGLPEGPAVHAFHASGYDARAFSDWSFGAMVARHLRTIRELAPTGPYVLVGHSFGGLLALETARRLTDAGKAVPLVALLDTRLPGALRQRFSRDGGAPAAPPSFGQRMAMHARLLGAGLVGYEPPVRDAVFWEQSLRLANRHRFAPWSGRTLLFTAEDNTDDPAGWASVLTGSHEVIPVAGGHSAILRPPFHRVVAERIAEELDGL
ncbi:alpha/beta fold hydrolase [Lentzea sp. NPDC058450]|uniref:alpha/beta fold hydrolase n=1 Tax=Lentzea sp. NPDC058450 TaxID=3346505 RepID=UPI003662BE5E